MKVSIGEIIKLRNIYPNALLSSALAYIPTATMSAIKIPIDVPSILFPLY
jgi:hypothetical protein